MDKMKMESADMTATNIEKIGALFPNCITETKDENGKPKNAINFELLKQMLSNDAIDGDEAYEFTWVGKKAAIVEANKPIRKTLRPVIKDEIIPTGKDNNGNPYCSSGSQNFDTTENLYIEGDNLDVLKLLQESYLGKIKMIYIDPPYNTGSDKFMYPDDFSISKDEYEEDSGRIDKDGNYVFQENNASDPRFHSKWCSMIYQRLLLARNLLAEDGVIFISIDYNEDFNARRISDEIFGSSSFVGEIYWESKTKSQNTTTSFNKLQPKAEMILVYSKLCKRRFNLIKKGVREYSFSDQKGSYREHVLEVMNADGIRGRKTMVFDISDDISIVSLPEGKQWKIGQEQVEFYKREKDLFIRDNKVIIKMRPAYERNDTTEPFWGFFSKDLGTAESAKKELTGLLGSHGFETVKPIEIIKRLVYHATNSADIILDFFSGSSTTAHAVMQLNAEDGGNRKFIMVQLPEVCSEDSEAYKAGYKNICEIGKERIRRAGEKIKAEIEIANQQLKLDEEEKKVPDIGFRVLKIDESNMTDVYYSADEYNQEMLNLLESNVKADRSDIDLLFSCLLEWGLPLSLSCKSEQIEGYTIHTYDPESGERPSLVACFDKNIPDSVVKAIAKRQPLRAVFRDSSFADSPDKINVTEIFKLLAPDTRVKVI